MTFSSCEDGDELDTNQYVKGIALNAFGPSPVARGGELRFIGSNLNQVTAVSIPGCADITDITVVSTEEIRVTVPQTAEPGLVTLRTPSGDITTISRLTYTEPVGFDADPFSPSTIKPGSVLTISSLLMVSRYQRAASTASPVSPLLLLFLPRLRQVRLPSLSVLQATLSLMSSILMLSSLSWLLL